MGLWRKRRSALTGRVAQPASSELSRYASDLVCAPKTATIAATLLLESKAPLFLKKVCFLGIRKFDIWHPCPPAQGSGQRTHDKTSTPCVCTCSFLEPTHHFPGQSPAGGNSWLRALTLAVNMTSSNSPCFPCSDGATLKKKIYIYIYVCVFMNRRCRRKRKTLTFKPAIQAKAF